MTPLLLLLCFVPFLRILIRACSLYCCLETESLNPTGLSRDSAAHIAFAATATMVERGTKGKLWAVGGSIVTHPATSGLVEQGRSVVPIQLMLKEGSCQ